MNELSARNRWFGSGAFTISSAKDFNESCCLSNRIEYSFVICFPEPDWPETFKETRHETDNIKKKYFWRAMIHFKAPTIYKEDHELQNQIKILSKFYDILRALANSSRLLKCRSMNSLGNSRSGSVVLKNMVFIPAFFPKS